MVQQLHQWCSFLHQFGAPLLHRVLKFQLLTLKIKLVRNMEYLLQQINLREKEVTMQKTLLCTIATAVALGISCPAFAGKGNGPGNGSGNRAHVNQSMTTKPVCDGTGPKGIGAGSKRPLDGRGRKQGTAVTAQQPTTQQPAEQTNPSAN